MRVAWSVVGIVVLATLVASACGSLTEDDCRHDAPSCVSATAYSICGVTTTCPGERACDPQTGGCVGRAVGMTCVEDRSCADELRCVDATCVGPSADIVARCRAAPSVTVPADGGAVAVDVEFSDASDFPALLIRPSCDGGAISYGGIAFVHLTVENIVSGAIIEENDAPPLTQLFGVTDCAALFASEAFASQCGLSGQTTQDFIHIDKPSFDLLIATAPGQPAASHYRFRIGN